MTNIWTPAKRAITALTLGQPDEIPTFELNIVARGKAAGIWGGGS